MSRDEALQLVKEYTKNENLVITASSDTTLALYNIQMEKPL